MINRVASTLPLWKDKKNVKITYTSISGAVETTFDDLVEYNKLSDEKGKISNTIKGIDRLEENGINGVSWKWLVLCFTAWIGLYDRRRCMRRIVGIFEKKLDIVIQIRRITFLFETEV